MTEPKWLTIARGELGTREIEGPKSNSRIIDYAKVSVGIAAPDSEAWCARFVGWCFARDGLDETTGSGKSNARSYMDWGTKLDEPRLGCVVVFWRGSKAGWEGHVAFWLREDATYVWCLGGNQGNAVSIAKYPKKQVLGYRWPSKVAKPAAPPAADPALKRVQARLKELGYHEVGTPDGLWGNRTRDAATAFRADWNEEHPDAALPAPATNSREAIITDAWLAALAKAEPRPVAAARETADEDRIGDYAAIKDSKKTGLVGQALTGVGLGGVVSETGVLDKAEAVSGWWGRVHGVVDPVWSTIEPLWPFLVIAAGVAIFFWVRRIRAEEIESHRIGETP